MIPVFQETLDSSNYLNCPNFHRAMKIAWKAHHSQLRKDGKPAISHPLLVVEILWNAGIRQSSILCAAILHDSLEDNPDKHREFIMEIGNQLPESVLKTVLILSDDMTLSSEERKSHQYVKFATTCVDARLIKLADLIANSLDFPPTWTLPKIQQRIAHCWNMLDVLSGTHQILESQLSHILVTMTVEKMTTCTV